MAEIIQFVGKTTSEPNPGNGAREALAGALSYCFEPMGDVFTDDLLARLWLSGFKIVPLTDEDGP